MVLLIKEELHHFYQVLEIMTERDIKYETITVPVVMLRAYLVMLAIMNRTH